MSKLDISIKMVESAAGILSDAWKVFQPPYKNGDREVVIEAKKNLLERVAALEAAWKDEMGDE